MVKVVHRKKNQEPLSLQLLRRLYQPEITFREYRPLMTVTSFSVFPILAYEVGSIENLISLKNHFPNLRVVRNKSDLATLEKIVGVQLVYLLFKSHFEINVHGNNSGSCDITFTYSNTLYNRHRNIFNLINSLLNLNKAFEYC